MSCPADRAHHPSTAVGPVGQCFIDVWDVGGFDGELLGALHKHQGLIRDSFTTDRQMMLERHTSDRLGPMPSNPYASAFYDVVEHLITPLMEVRTIRAWHYTRLTDAEIDLLRTSGIYLLTWATVQQRVDALVEAGVFSRDTAAALLAASPLHDSDEDARSNKFWLVSQPECVDGGGVAPLMESWGGESVYFRQRDPALQALLKRIGKACIIEVAVPVAATNRAYWAAGAVVAAFGRSLSCEPDRGAFDFYLTRALGPESILAIHAEEDPYFQALADGEVNGFEF